MINEIKTVAAYDSLTQENEFAVVQFGFRWNSFDRTMLRNLIELEPEFGGAVVFGFVDVDEDATLELVQRVNLVNSPTLIYFARGVHAATDVGMKPMDDVRSRLKVLLAKQ